MPVRLSHRRRARELALQILFQADVGKAPLEVVLEQAREEHPREDWAFIVSLCAGVADHRRSLDAQITAHLSGWTFERMASIDRSVLRMALYELQHTPTPPSVVINEAVALAKKYGTGDSGRFVNGVLGAIYRETASPADAS